VVLGASLLLVFVVKPFLPPSAAPALVAYALFVTSVVFCAATISNDNLQDLKTGQLVDATPWRQQVALIVGVAAGAIVIPPILNLLNQAYGFAGAPGVNPARALAAPQATLISALARGVIQGDLDWSLIGSGAVVGIAVILIDEGLRRFTTVQMPPLAVGLGIYLPSATTLMIVVGAIAGWAYDRRAARTRDPDGTRQLGTLMASGMIVGESLVGVALAAIVVFSGNAAPLALVGDDFAQASVWIGALVFGASILAMYTWLNRISGPAPAVRTEP
jgi:putative OPT family oligopeptide transporter